MVLFKRTGLLGTVAAGVVGVLTVQLVVEPWVVAGRLDDLMSVIPNLTQVMPSVSANGHNLWWLKLPGDALVVFDSTPVGGFGEWVAPPLITHATLGRLGFGLFALLPLLRLTGPISVRLVAACAAYTSAAYFMTVTQVHENHMFAALPFLAAAAALDAWFILPFVIASTCVFFNMALHDFLVGDHVTTWVAQWLPWKEAVAIQTANARLNVAGFGLFTLILLRRPSVPRQSKRMLVWRARFVLVTGIAIAGGALLAVEALVRRPELAQQAWERLAERALASGPAEVHLGRSTPALTLLERAASEFVNGMYLLAIVAVIVGTVAALAGAWWLLCGYASGRRRTA